MLSQPTWLWIVKDGMWGYVRQMGTEKYVHNFGWKNWREGATGKIWEWKDNIGKFLIELCDSVTQQLQVKLNTEMNLWAPQRVVNILYSLVNQPSKVRGL